MKQFLILFALLLAIVGCNGGKRNPDGNNARPLRKSEFPNVANTVYGSWLNTETLTNHGVTYKMRIFINQAKIGIEMECESITGTVHSGFALRAFVNESANAIEVVENGSKSEKSVDGYSCDAQMYKTRMIYSLRGNSLSLTSGGRDTMNLQRF